MKTLKINPNIKNKFIYGVLAGVLAAVIWGLWPVITRFGVTTNFNPEEIVVVRFLFAGLLLLPFYIKSKVYLRISPFKSLIISLGAGAVYVYVSALGLRYVPAGHLGVVGTGTMIALSTLGGYLFLGERKSFIQILGYIVVFAGMLIVNRQSFTSSLTNVLYGDLLLVLGGALWASYTLFAKKWNLNPWDAVASVSVWSLFTWAPLIFIFGEVNFSLQVAQSWLLQGLAQGVVAAIAGLWLYTIAVNFLGASKGSLFGALVPSIAVLGGFIFLSEVPTIIEIIGVFLTTLGIVISFKDSKA